MGFIDAVKTCFRKYLTVSGRAARPEFWFFTLFCFLGNIATGLLDLALGFGQSPTLESAGFTPINLVFVLATFIPSITATVRRLHDMNNSGWWCLVGLIPLLGIIGLLLYCIRDGSYGDNRFGPDPKGRDPVDEMVEGI